MTRRTIDFDAFRAEKKAEPLELTLGGRVFELPPSMPAPLALDVLRLHEMGPDADVPLEKIVALGEGIFGGEEKLREVLTLGNVTLTELPDLIKMVVEAYTASGGDDPSPTAQE